MPQSVRIGLLILIFATATVGVTPTVSLADFLGLVPGDYVVTLNGSSGLCGGTDCTGAVHVPLTNASLTSEFHWFFDIGGQIFDWTPPGLATSVSPNGLNSCAIEGEAPTGAICAVNDAGPIVTLNEAPFLSLFAIGGAQSYSVVLAGDVFLHGMFETSAASSVPEPSAASMLLSGIAICATARVLVSCRGRRRLVAAGRCKAFAIGTVGEVP